MKVRAPLLAPKLAQVPRRRAPQRSMLDVLWEMERRLIAKGFPPMSEWWRATLERFYRSGRRQLVLRVGRRGGKSSTLCRVAVLEALAGEHAIPPGDVGMFAIVSVSRTEAAQRLRTIRAILDALEEPHHPADGGIELERRPVVFRVFTASIAGVSGPTCIGTLCDEVAKWHDDDTGANPATEVLASLRPTLLTQPNAKMFLSSSPFGFLDAHAKAFEEGETDRQLAFHAATWTAHPALTEEMTRAEEPDPAVWAREYAAIPQEALESSILSPVLLDRATRGGEVGREYGCFYVAFIDPAFRGNAWTLVVATKRLVAGRLARAIVCCREWRGTPGKPLDPERVLGEIAACIGPYGIDMVTTDQHAGDALVALARRIQVRISETETKPLRIVVEPMTAPLKLQRWEDVGTWFAEGCVEIPKHAQLRADLLAARKRLTPNGYTVTLAETPDGRHADFAPAAAGALSKASRDPVVKDSRPEVVIEQEAAFKRVHAKYRKKPEQPWWKRTG